MRTVGFFPRATGAGPAGRIPWTAIAFGGATIAVLSGIALISRRSKRSPARVALIGDSYAVGLGPELAKLLPDFKFEGYVGTRTDQWANHSQGCGHCGDWLAAFKPNVVLVSLGTNDGASPNPANYQAIVGTIHGIGARAVWIEPPAAVKVPAARAVIASLGVPTIPAPTLPMASGGLHPKSYSSWAAEIARTETA